MHVVIHPASTERGGCLLTGCGGYRSNVISLYTFRTICHSLKFPRTTELTLGLAYVEALTTVTSSLSRLHPKQT